MTVAVFAGFQTLLILNIGKFQNFAKLLMIFVEFRSKFTLSIFYRISNVVHVGVWIFSGLAQWSQYVYNVQLSSFERSKNKTFADLVSYMRFPDLIWVTSSDQNINVARKQN